VSTADTPRTRRHRLAGANSRGGPAAIATNSNPNAATTIMIVFISVSW
jgi:hypothetical protein